MGEDLAAYRLFQQALVHRDPEAWRELYARYENLVAAWVRRHPAFPHTGESVAYFVNRAFDKLFTAVDARKFRHFPDAASLLRYLKMCVHSSVLDVVRQQERAALDNPVRVAEAPDPEAQALANLQREELWSLVESVVRDERERVVVYESFVCGIRPQQVRRRHPHLFPSVEAVYLAKRNVLLRLRRHPRLQALYGQG